ncbi:hypothetical protein [Nevskia ramosa]|nr:hypothetical protein [Nevskia ramosa]
MLLSIEQKLDWTRIPRLQRWFETVRTRPAVVRGFKAFDPS